MGSLKTRRNITNDAWMGNHKPIYDALAELQPTKYYKILGLRKQVLGSSPKASAGFTNPAYLQQEKEELTQQTVRLCNEWTDCGLTTAKPFQFPLAAKRLKLNLSNQFKNHSDDPTHKRQSCPLRRRISSISQVYFQVWTIVIGSQHRHRKTVSLQ